MIIYIYIYKFLRSPNTITPFFWPLEMINKHFSFYIKIIFGLPLLSSEFILYTTLALKFLKHYPYHVMSMFWWLPLLLE